MAVVRTRRRPDNQARIWRAYKATPIGAPADGLCAGCSRAILRGDTIRVNDELQVVHWDCWHRDIEWRARVFDDLATLVAPQTDTAGAPGE
jgi:hypothetical protein